MSSRQGPASRARHPRTHSEAEEKFLEILRQLPIPMPQMNVVVAGCELDCWWPEERLAVEIDGYVYHGSRRSYEGDRRRDAMLAAAGIQVIRITWQQLMNEPLAVMVRLAQALALRSTRRAGPELN